MSAQHEVTTLLRRALNGPSDFYRRRLSDAGVRSVTDIDSVTFTRLPLTRRDELVRDQLAHAPKATRPVADAAPPVRAGVTRSGDALLVLTWTANDLARERAAGARLFRRLGIEAGTPVANTLPGALATPGSLLLGDVMEEIGALDVPLGTIDSDTAARQAWELVDRVQPGVLVLEPSTGARFLAAAPETTRAWWRGIVWLRTDSTDVVAAAPPSPLPGAGFTGWQRTWLAIAETTSFVALSCAARRFHLDDGIIAEVVDDTTGAAIAPGEPGLLVVTPLGMDTLVLRYASYTRARARADACACGAAGPAVDVL